MRFDFNEINILMQNLRDVNQKKGSFLETLRALYDNTDDALLKDSVLSLIKKVSSLSQQELSGLCSSILQKRVVATMNDPFSANFTRSK